MGGQLFVGRCPTLLVFDLRDRLLDTAGTAADRSRHPVELAQTVVDRTADTRHGKRLELDPAFGIEPLDRVDQAEHTRADEISRVDTRGQAGADTAGDELHQR